MLLVLFVSVIQRMLISAFQDNNSLTTFIHFFKDKHFLSKISLVDVLIHSKSQLLDLCTRNLNLFSKQMVTCYILRDVYIIYIYRYRKTLLLAQAACSILIEFFKFEINATNIILIIV